MDVNDLVDVAEKMVGLAQKFGAEESDAIAARNTEFEVKVADGKISTLTQATSKGLGLRVFVNKRLGFCTISDFSNDAMAHAAERVVAMAKEAASDPHNGLPEELEADRIDAGEGLELFDPSIPEVSADTKIQWAHEIEQAAREVDPRVAKFRDSGVANGDSFGAMVTSTGATRTMRSSGISLWASPIAEADGQLQTESWWDSQTFLSDLDSPASVGKRAAERAVRMLGAKPVPTQNVPVIFEPHMAAGFLAGILGAMDGDMVFKDASYLAKLLNQGIATPKLTIIDDPLKPRAAGSTPFDGEGLPTRRKTLVDKGVLQTFLYDTYTARKTGNKSNASARRSYASLPHVGTFNFTVEPDPTAGDFESLVTNSKKALIMTRGLGSGVNTVTGEYSRGANGLWVENGEITHAVQEVTVAGNYLDMLRGIDHIGSDFEMRGSAGAPSIRLSDVTLSGS